MARKVITVDGLAGSGKSTLSKLLAERLGYVHFNSGLLYRVIGYLAIQSGVSRDDEDAVLTVMQQKKISLTKKDGLMIDGVTCPEPLIRTPDVSEAASKVAAHPKVREALIELQRTVFPEDNIVAEGRDMGTVIFPNADLKFFVTAATETRVKRRMAQLGLTDEKSDLIKQIEREIIERDKRDSERAVAPTVAAKDAVQVDNSSLPLAEVVQNMYEKASQLS